jgi:hypothetical protein
VPPAPLVVPAVPLVEELVDPAVPLVCAEPPLPAEPDAVVVLVLLVPVLLVVLALVGLASGAEFTGSSAGQPQRVSKQKANDSERCLGRIAIEVEMCERSPSIARPRCRFSRFEKGRHEPPGE